MSLAVSGPLRKVNTTPMRAQYPKKHLPIVVFMVLVGGKGIWFCFVGRLIRSLCRMMANLSRQQLFIPIFLVIFLALFLLGLP